MTFQTARLTRIREEQDASSERLQNGITPMQHLRYLWRTSTDCGQPTSRRLPMETEVLGNFRLGFPAEEDASATPDMVSSKMSLQHIRSDNLDKDVLRQVKRNIESSNARLIERYGDSMPSQVTLNKLTEALRSVFQPGSSTINADLEECAKQPPQTNASKTCLMRKHPRCKVRHPGRFLN